MWFLTKSGRAQRAVSKAAHPASDGMPDWSQQAETPQMVRNPDLAATRDARRAQFIVWGILASLPFSLWACISSVTTRQMASDAAPAAHAHPPPTTSLVLVVSEESRRAAEDGASAWIASEFPDIDQSRFIVRWESSDATSPTCPDLSLFCAVHYVRVTDVATYESWSLGIVVRDDGTTSALVGSPFYTEWTPVQPVSPCPEDRPVLLEEASQGRLDEVLTRWARAWAVDDTEGLTELAPDDVALTGSWRPLLSSSPLDARDPEAEPAYEILCDFWHYDAEGGIAVLYVKAHITREAVYVMAEIPGGGERLEAVGSMPDLWRAPKWGVTTHMLSDSEIVQAVSGATQ